MLLCFGSVLDHRCRLIVVKTKKWHMSCRRVCQWCFTTFWRLLWSITDQAHGNMESISIVQWRERKKQHIYIPASYHLPVRGSICAALQVTKATFRPSFFFFFFILLTYSLSEKFFNVFCQKQNNRENVSKFTMTSYGKFYKEFFQMRHFQVVKNSYCLGSSAFLIYRQLTLNFFSWPSLAKSENVFQPLSKPRPIEHNKENKLPCVIHVSVCLTKRFHDSVRLLCNTVDPRCRQMIVKTKQWHTSRGCVTHIFFPTHVMTSSVIYND